MHLKVRSRLQLWLFIATLPIFGAGIFVVAEVNSRVSTRVERDLQNLVELEAARINDELAAQEIDAGVLAELPLLLNTLETVEPVPTRADSPGGRNNVVGSLYNNLAESLASYRGASGLRNTEDVRIVDREGETVGTSDGFSWEPFDETIIERSMDERRVIFGNAFRSGVGDDRVGLVVPIVTDDGSVLGALLVENRLNPIVDLLSQYEGFGETSEAVVSQHLPGGQVGLVTLRRFERDAAFNSVLDAEDQYPSAVSTRVDSAEVLRLVDYRGVDTIAAVQRITVTGWGLTVKIDESEALALSRDLSRYVVLACVLTVLVLIVGWFTQVRPIGRRLRKTVAASGRLVRGDYLHLIGDTSQDEIGDLARRIDGMATELEADRKAKKKAEELLRYQASHDTLTGLVNRQRASDLIDEFGERDVFSLLFLDVDGFKHINDSYGHAVGDQVLAEVAGRLASAIRGNTTWARWGGDEFLAILPNTDESAATEVVAEVRQLFADPIVSDVGHHTIGASVGVATSGEGRTPSDVLHEADVAMFRSKRRQGADDEVSSDTIKSVELALSQGRVEAVFQPVVRLDQNKKVHLNGAEALVRIRNEDGSIMLPAEFLPALGSNKLAAALDTRVAEVAMGQLSRWLEERVVPEHFRIAVNIGSASMADPQLVTRLTATMERWNINPANVLIEIPETVEVVDADTLDALRTLGVRLAIDDVGCQYSNLERMVDIKADVAKLDRRWIPDLATAESSTSEVLRGLVGQCRALGFDLIAEGVETEDQLEMLRNLGIDVFQGYLFGRPVSPTDFERNWRDSTSSSDRGQAEVVGAGASDRP